MNGLGSSGESIEGIWDDTFYLCVKEVKITLANGRSSNWVEQT